MEKFGISRRDGIYVYKERGDFYARWKEFRDEISDLQEEIGRMRSFAKARWRAHVAGFYKFLKCAGVRVPTLVVRGDHDDDYANDYQTERINRIPGCSEVGGRCLDVKGFRFLGLNFCHTHYRRRLRGYLAEYTKSVDVVITHCEQSTMPLVGSLRPKLIIRGHFGSGKYLVNGIPCAFTADVHHTVIDLSSNSLPVIRQYVSVHGSRRRFKEQRRGSCKPWRTTKSEFDRYQWLLPYPKPKNQVWRCRTK